MATHAMFGVGVRAITSVMSGQSAGVTELNFVRLLLLRWSARLRSLFKSLTISFFLQISFEERGIKRGGGDGRSTEPGASKHNYLEKIF